MGQQTEPMNPEAAAAVPADSGGPGRAPLRSWLMMNGGQPVLAGRQDGARDVVPHRETELDPLAMALAS